MRFHILLGIMMLKNKPRVTFKKSLVSWLWATWNNAQRLFVASLVLLTIAVGLLSVAAYKIYHLPPAHQSTPATPFALDTVVSGGQVKVKISAVRYGLSSQDSTAATDDMHYIIMTLAITNTGDTPIQVLPSKDTYIKDSEGHVLFLTPYNLDNPFRAGELPPGESIQGELSFAARKSEHYTFYIDALWSGSVLPFAIR